MHQRMERAEKGTGPGYAFPQKTHTQMGGGNRSQPKGMVAIMEITSPCLLCPISRDEKNGPVCEKCEARYYYATTVIYWETFTREQKAHVKLNLSQMIPSREQIKNVYSNILNNKHASRIKTKTYTGKRPRMKLRTFRAFYHAARRDGFSDIRKWIEGDYVKNRRTSVYMRKKVGCAAVTLYKMLQIYGAPQPEEHIKYKTMGELDGPRVTQLLKQGETLTKIAVDQGCSYGLIYSFKKLMGITQPGARR